MPSEARAKVRPENTCPICEIAEVPKGSRYCAPCRRISDYLPLHFIPSSLGLHLANIELAIANGDLGRALRCVDAAKGVRDALESSIEDYTDVQFLKTCTCGRRYTRDEYDRLSPAPGLRTSVPLKLCLCQRAI